MPDIVLRNGPPQAMGLPEPAEVGTCPLVPLTPLICNSPVLRSESQFVPLVCKFICPLAPVPSTVVVGPTKAVAPPLEVKVAVPVAPPSPTMPLLPEVLQPIQSLFCVLSKIIRVLLVCTLLGLPYGTCS